MPVPSAKFTRTTPYDGATSCGTHEATDVRGIADAGVAARNGRSDGSTRPERLFVQRLRSLTNAPASHSDAKRRATAAAAACSAWETSTASWSVIEEVGVPTGAADSACDIAGVGDADAAGVSAGADAGSVADLVRPAARGPTTR